MRRTEPRQEGDLTVTSLVDDVPPGHVPVLEDTAEGRGQGTIVSDMYEFSETEEMYARLLAGEREGIPPELVAAFEAIVNDVPERHATKRDQLPIDAFGI